MKKLIKAICFVVLLTTSIIGLSSCSNNNDSDTVSSRELFNETNREDFLAIKKNYDEMKKKRNSQISLLSSSTETVEECDYEEADALFELGFSVLNMIEEQTDENEIMEYFVENLTEEQKMN